MNVTANKSHSIDFLRAAAILFVIIVHVSQVNIKDLPAWIIITSVSSVAKVAVPIFIMISGALILGSSKKLTLKEFYKRRLSRIGIPLLFWPFFYYFSFIIFSHKTFSFVNLFNDYMYLNMYFHLYFLYIIAGLYAITPLLKSFITKLKITDKRNVIYVTLVYSIILTALHYYAPSRFNYWTIFTVFIPFIGYYIAGYYFINIKKYNYKVLTIIYIAILIETVIIKYFMQLDIKSTWINQYPADALSINLVPLAIITFILLFKISKSELFSNLNIIKNISKYSFGIYLIHPIYLYGYKFIPYNKFNINLNDVINSIFEFIIVFTFSYFTIKILIKIPYVNKLIS